MSEVRQQHNRAVVDCSTASPAFDVGNVDAPPLTVAPGTETAREATGRICGPSRLSTYSLALWNWVPAPGALLLQH